VKRSDAITSTTQAPTVGEMVFSVAWVCATLPSDMIVNSMRSPPRSVGFWASSRS
jgi:hypothetical protein